MKTHGRALALAITAILILFARDVGDIANQWWNSSTYGHCLFVLPLVGWLIWQRRHEVARVEPRAWLPGIVVVGIAAFGWLIGQAADVAVIRQASLVGMIQASVLAILGPAMVRALLFPIFYLVFLIPLGDEIVPAMQTLTARITMALLGMVSLPAQLDGVFITTPTGWFKVAEACAGVKFLVAMIAYGALVANVCFRNWQRRTIFMAICIAAPILANGVRAFGTIMVAHWTSIEAATGFDHIVYGWLFFAFVIAVVMAAAWPFFDRKPGDPWLDAPPVAIGMPRSANAVAMATIGIAMTPLLWDGLVVASGRSPLPHAVALPDVTRWTRVVRTDGYPWAPRFDGADHKLAGRYRRADGATVDLAIALYGWQGDGRKIVGYAQGAIDPVSQWSWSANTSPPPGGKAQRMLAPGRIEREALTFYVIGGRATGNAMIVKAKTLQGRLTGGDQAAAVVIVSAEGKRRAVIDAFLNDLGSVDRHANRLIATARGS